ncbi:MAG: transcription-repair coupling factor [Omnitrophica WOR_2 bacterium RIFCSPHIGHO2_02_FULL_48_11]|nr:MAG: transcription-repair coupling factor [Omnitrophica WOR_2 bacterium RIFCSPHIGHO2_02_FULL_48_11]
MFKSFKLFVGQTIAKDDILKNLEAFRYQHTQRAIQEGEYAQRGEIIDIFPANFDSPVRIDLDDDQIHNIASVNTQTGKSIWQHKILIIVPATQGKRTAFSSDIPLNSFVDIQKGDYVVHNQHGIGKFLGITDLDVRSPEKTHLVIEYQGGDKLFVPKHDLHLVQKYVSFAKKPPRLFKLGSQEWKRVRLQIQKRIQHLAAELLHTQAVRASLKGFQFSSDAPWQGEFEKSFPFLETKDQLKAAEEVKKDMESGRPMDRLLCGDVGYGKTEVALRAIFKAVMDNKQAAVLVPTTILAEQHCFNFTNRLKNFPVKVAMLSRFRTKREQHEIIKDLREGKVDVVIGTHRLLSKDIQFKDLGLIVIDEEQRFGVKAKEKLKHLRLLVDVLTLTATPIPRTLYMALAGAKDMSVISTPPQNRIPVETRIVEFDEDLLKEAILQEIHRKGQVFFLHNRVEDINRIALIIKRMAPAARMSIAHGQMPPKLLEEIMLKFLKGDIDILICTSIIESGIDIPNANTLIVNRADRFGLADLHQLRGRVGRFTAHAYAYFIVPPEKTLSTVAKTRLKALAEHSGLGAGFQIAFEDLQLRGAGNLLGEEQHGYITAIGFDLYCRLLKESVEHLKLQQESKNYATKN